MKRSNLFLGASAFILAIAGAFTTKAAKQLHQVTFATKGSGSCVTQVRQDGLTAITIANATAFTVGGTTTLFRKTSGCTVTLFNRGDN